MTEQGEKDMNSRVDHSQHQQPLATAPSNEPEPTCKHGAAWDVHCCGCHSGFLFDTSNCVCLNRPGDDFQVIGSGYESGFDAGYAKGFADGMDVSAGDPRVERIEAGFKAMHEATNGEYSREDMTVMDALQAGRDFAVGLARRETHIQQLIGEREARARVEGLVLALQAHAKEHNWQDVDDPIAALLGWRL